MKFIPFRNLQCPGLETAVWYCRLLFLTGVGLIVFGIIKEGLALYHWCVELATYSKLIIASIYNFDLLSRANFHLMVVGVVKVYFACGLAIKLKSMSHEKS
ncbi:hypothetical protein [Pseudoalteromonas sp. PS5]|uniref:hypothetical protein n=1 Tax=Pseudoalteromonas sp. PS5 TaxID=1437473 RepID=UPI000FFEF111|nr:hypothetical protein [Pseudoalteromonas sp. PS5]RXE98413.1 hypothetical protein D9603_17180 [Pseudoalteromonas sp. PS5]